MAGDRTSRDGRSRIRKPLLYPTELRDQTRKFPRHCPLTLHSPLKTARFRSLNSWVSRIYPPGRSCSSRLGRAYPFQTAAPAGTNRRARPLRLRRLSQSGRDEAMPAYGRTERYRGGVGRRAPTCPRAGRPVLPQERFGYAQLRLSCARHSSGPRDPSAAMLRRVELPPRRLDRRAVLPRPQAETAYRIQQ
jgi:hypothetical protein